MSENERMLRQIIAVQNEQIKFMEETVDLLQEQLDLIKNPTLKHSKKQTSAKKPVSKTGNLIHFPVGKENKKEN